MMKSLFSILLALAIVAPATAAPRWSWDGQTFSVQLTGDHGSQPKTDTWTFQGHQLTSEWLGREGFTQSHYHANHHEFKATFRKGEDRVYIEGRARHGGLEGHLKWARRHEGGHTHWHFVATAGAAPAAAPEAVAQAPAAPASLYARLGGNGAITAVVNDFVDMLVADPVQTANPHILKAFKKTNVPRLKADLTNFVCHVTGGPEAYTGRDMKVIHKNMAISDKEWGAMANDFVTILNKYKVPQAEQNELLSIVGTTKADIVTRR